MKKKSMILAGLSALMSVSVLFGCGAKTEGEGASANSGSSEKSETTELRFLDVNPSELRQEYYEDAFARFEEETGIKAIYESVPWDDAANRLTVMGTSNTLPDVMSVNESWRGQFIPAGWIIPLDDYIDPVRDDFNEFIKNIIFVSEEEQYGGLYTVPDGIMVKGVYVRKDWCEEIGYELNPDWTYSDYFDLIEKLTDPEKNRYGIAFRGARNGLDPFLFYFESLKGGQLYDDEGNCYFLDDDAPEIFEKFCDTYKKGYAPQDAINWGFAEMVDNFQGGLVGTLMNDSEVAATLKENMDDSQWTVLPIPKSDTDGKIYNSTSCSYSYAISDDCKDPDAAWKLIEFLSRPDNNMEYCRAVGMLPVKKDVGDDPDFSEGGIYAAFVAQLNDPDMVKPAYWGPFDYTDLQQATFHEEMQKYLLDQKSAKEVLTGYGEELTARMKTYLEEHPGTSVEKARSMD